MTVTDVIAFARSGELKKLSEVTYDDTTLISYINLGLIEIYKRFNLSTKEQSIDLDDNTTIYALNSDCMKVLNIFDENGDEYNLNDESDVLSIFEVNWNEIQVPNPDTGATISVIYMAEPTTMTAVGDTVPIPSQYLEPLLHYIGYRAHSAQNGNVNAENSTHYTRFEMSCKRLETLGLTQSDDVINKYTTQEKGYV